MGGQAGTTRLLLKYKADVNATAHVRHPHIARLELLLSERTLIRCRFQRNATALHWAVRKGDVPTITTLIEAGADIQAEDETGQTPWHQAKVGGGDVLAAFPVMSPRGI